MLWYGAGRVVAIVVAADSAVTVAIVVIVVYCDGGSGAGDSSVVCFDADGNRCVALVIEVGLLLSLVSVVGHMIR